MRSISKKGNGGYQLNRSHENPPATAHDAESRWGSFSYKNDVTGYLGYEQYNLCAYSEVRPDKEGLGTHIEHVEPKSLNPHRTFDYSNLVLSALSDVDLKTQSAADVFGGHAKGSNYDPAQFISCLRPGCSNHFVYLSDGRIEPAIGLSVLDKERVKYTIDLLNLNCDYLVNKRKNWLNELDALIDDHIANNQSLECLAAVDLIPINNSLSPFFTATRQRFSHIAETILATQCPELL
uniref:retron system putative HNH endonuclease n=1 Tax=Cellvibrio fontiphilus TaxID=1815559 RepID=UPI002B4BAB7D|nr:retron system putative HNH endonuclease [Cellvibrio fontiphilus]